MGESFVLSSVASGTLPLVYQWRINGSALEGATNSTLFQTNLNTGNAGNYSVVVTNSGGGVTSSVASLFVVDAAPRVVWVKDIVSANGGSAARAPLVFNANGRENEVRFSLGFDTNAFANPAFDWAAGNDASVDLSELDAGRIGMTVSRPLPEMYPVGEQDLGSITFDLIGTNGPLNGRLEFTDGPTTMQAVDTNGLEMLLTAVVVVQVELLDSEPALNLQTGLFEQRVNVANPSAATFNNLPVYVPDPGTDSLTNVMFLYDSAGSATVDVNGDGERESTLYFIVTNLPPGGAQVFTNGFYVTDHVTTPLPAYYPDMGGTPGVPMPSTSTSAPGSATAVPVSVIEITVIGFNEEGRFVFEWPTRADETYSVQYAASLEELANPAAVKTSPAIVEGTGTTVEWVDTNPPDSGNPSTVSARFYRVLQNP